MIDPTMSSLLMFLAAQNPAQVGPALDASGIGSPDQLLPLLTQLTNGSQPNMFAPPQVGGGPTPAPGATLTQPPAGFLTNPTGGMPMSAPLTEPAQTATLPDGMNMESLLRMFMGNTPTATPLQQPQQVTGPLPASVTNVPRTAPQAASRPEAQKPIMSGGVAGAQKAPEMGMQMTAGGTPAQIALAALLGGRGGAANPLRVPPLGALLAGAA